MKTNIIFIEVSGPVQTGKSAVLASIKELLEVHGYLAAVMDRAAKHNPPRTIANAHSHELPAKDSTLFVLTEDLRKV